MASAPQPGLSIDISMLEKTAKDISLSASAKGSDIGVEIRRIMSEERERERSLSRSRSQSQSSSSHHNHNHIQQPPEPPFHHPTTRPRRISSIRSRATSNSYANSVSDARMGITSPVSMHSAFEPLQEGRPLDSPLAPSASMRSAASQYSSYSQDPAVSRRLSQSSLVFSYTQDNAMSRQASQSSFAQRFDGMASQIEEKLHIIPQTPELDHPRQEYGQQEHEQPHERGLQLHVVDIPDRPHSTDTFQEAELAFKDFDGVHFNPATEEYVAVDENGNEVRRVSARTSSGSLLDAAQVLRTRPVSYAASTQLSRHVPSPAPEEFGMVYYPAPVPRMLNLPKRLSQLPAESVQAKRRTQLYNEMHEAPIEEQAPTIPKLDFDETEDEPARNRSVSEPLAYEQPVETHPKVLTQRMSFADMRNLPPQLRASVYFEQPSLALNLQVKHASAVATLDSILAASATAPVSAFTDHPFAGDVRKSVYAMERPNHNRQNTSTTLLSNDAHTKKLKKKRSSSIGNFFRRSSGDLLDTESRRPPSRGSQMLDGGQRLQKRKSQMSLADPLERERTLQELEGKTSDGRSSGLVNQAANSGYFDDHEGLHQVKTHLSQSGAELAKPFDDGQQIAEDFREQEALSDVDDTEPIFAQPSTLLAELQVRKAQMKQRTRTAAVAYPNGMHNTLLELDAVEQINKKKRQKQRIALAWEDPHQRELDEEVNEDEDVPLGVLYPTKDGKQGGKTGDSRDRNRPMGLMEQREMEDTEPLSKRADRLNPARAQERRAFLAHQRKVSQMQVEMQMAEEEEMRKEKEREVLNDAIVDVVPKAGSRPISTFSADVLSQFGGLNESKDAEATVGTEGEVEPEEETLGQRKARLQRERSTSGEVTGTQPAMPALRSTNSMANLLSSNPVRAPVPARAGWEGHNQQGLLQKNAAQQERQKAGLREANLGRVSSMGLGATGGAVGGQRRKSTAAMPGMLGGIPARPTNGAFVPTAGAAVGFASPTAGVASSMGFAASSPMGMPRQQFNPSAYYALVGGGGQHVAAPAPNMTGYYSPTMQQQPMYSPSMMQMQMPMQMPYGYGMQGQGMSMFGQNGSSFQQQAVPGQVYPGMNGMPMMGTGMGMGVEMPQNPAQRAAIDRWRMGIAQ